MSKYTTEVRYICESMSGLRVSSGANNVDEIIDNAIDKVFNFDFPIFDVQYRSVLEKKILKHFYTREIGEETVGLWQLRLNTKLNEIMPYYNKLYQSELIEFNPMYTTNLTRDGSREGTEQNNRNQNGNTTSNGTTNGTSWNLYSDTPQGSVGNLDNNTYLTNATKNTNNVGDSRNVYSNDYITDKGDSTEKYLEHIVGYQGSNASEMLLKYRKTFLNIDMQIINELEVLFMQLW